MNVAGDSTLVHAAQPGADSAGRRNPTGLPYPVWLAASILIHILLVQGVDGRFPSAEVRRPASPQPLSVRIFRPLPPRPAVLEYAAGRPPSAPETAATPARPAPPSRQAAGSESPPGRKEHTPPQREPLPKGTRSGRDLGRILRSRTEAAAAAAREETGGIFDPHLRKALEKARREQRRRERLAERLEKPDAVQELQRDGEHVTVRIGDSCWKVPVDDDPNDHVTRIWMAVPECPGPKKRLFSWQKTARPSARRD